MRARHRTALVIAILAMVALATPAFAQPYPNKPIRMLIPSPPGGGTDILGRLLREGLAELWMQHIVVDNRGGASGRIAAAATARRRRGYTRFLRTAVFSRPFFRVFRTIILPIRFAPIAMKCAGRARRDPRFPAKT